MGNFIEGGARWGFDPIWKIVANDESSDSDDSDEEITESEPPMCMEPEKLQRQQKILLKAH